MSIEKVILIEEKIYKEAKKYTSHKRALKFSNEIKKLIINEFQEQIKLQIATMADEEIRKMGYIKKDEEDRRIITP